MPWQKESQGNVWQGNKHEKHFFSIPLPNISLPNLPENDWPTKTRAEALRSQRQNEFPILLLAFLCSLCAKKS